MTFKADLEFANAIDAWFIATYPDLFGPAHSRTHDLIYLPTGELVEIKAERRNSDCPNLFVETISNDNKQTLGGPARAAADGVTYFIYIHSSDKKMYCFETTALLHRVQELVKTKNLKQHKIFNGTYRSLGYAVPKELLLDLCIPLEGTCQK